MWVVLKAHLPHLTTKEATDLLKSALLRTHRSWELSTLSAAKARVVDVLETVAIEEADYGLLQHTRRIDFNSIVGAQTLSSLNDINRKDFASATRRGTVSSNVRSSWVWHHSTPPTSKNDDGKAALRTN
jgi:hypothetical protein